MPAELTIKPPAKKAQKIRSRNIILSAPSRKRKALLLSHGYVNTDQFELTQPRVLNIKTLAAPRGKRSLPGQDDVMLGSIEIGQEQVGELEEDLEIIDTSVFAIFEGPKGSLPQTFKAYFGNGLQNDQEG